MHKRKAIKLKFFTLLHFLQMSRGGVLIEIEHNSPIVISKLTLANVVSSDSGIYTCKSVAGSDSIQLHVIEGKDCKCNEID